MTTLYKYYEQWGFSYKLVKAEGNKVILEISCQGGSFEKKLIVGYEVIVALVPGLDYYDIDNILNEKKRDFMFEHEGCVLIGKQYKSLAYAEKRFDEIDGASIGEQEASTIDDLDSGYLGDGCRRTLSKSGWYYESVYDR